MSRCRMGTGVDFLNSLNAQRNVIPVILIPAHGSVELAVEALTAGALDFVTKPLDDSRMRRCVSERRCLSDQWRSDQ